MWHQTRLELYYSDVFYNFQNHNICTHGTTFWNLSSHEHSKIVINVPADPGKIPESWTVKEELEDFKPKEEMIAGHNNVVSTGEISEKENMPQNSVNKKRFSCSVCEYKTVRKDNILQHMKVHSGVNLPCPKCEFKTTYKGNLVKHIQRVHSGDKRFRCSLCQYTKLFRKQIL